MSLLQKLQVEQGGGGSKGWGVQAGVGVGLPCVFESEEREERCSSRVERSLPARQACLGVSWKEKPPVPKEKVKKFHIHMATAA